MSAHVVARTSVFKEALTELDVAAGTYVKDVLKQLKIMSVYHALTYVNGVAAPHNYELKDNDLLNVTVVPGMTYGVPLLQPAPQQQPKNTGRALLGGIVGIGGLSASYLLSRFSGQRTADSDPKQNAAGISGYVAPPSTLPVRPWITGSSNQIQRGSKIPYIAGNYLMRPSHSAMPWTLIQGQNQYMNFAFDLGLGPTVYSDHKIGDKKTSQIPELVHFEVAPQLTQFPYDYEELAINEPVTNAMPITKLAPQLCDQLVVVLSFDQGLYQTVVQTNAQGQQVTRYVPTSVNVRIEYRDTAGGSFQTLFLGALNANSQRTYRVPWSVNISRNNLYEVRVTRNSPDSTDPNIVNGFSWAILRATLFQSPVRTFYDSQGNQIIANQAGLQLLASSNINGNVDDYSCMAFHQCQKYDGVSWGAAVTTSNPAWIFADMLTGPFFDSRVLKSELDAAAFKSWADYCDLMGYQFNYIFDQATDLTEALKMVAAAGRASFVIRDGKYTPIVDRPQTVVRQHFTPANSWDYSMTRAWPRKAEALEITFANKNLKYEEDMRIVYWDGFNSSSTQVVSQKMSLPGIVDPSMVYKFGRWLMRTMRLRPVTHEIATDIQHVCCNVGDLVRLTHDVPRLGVGEGYIKSVSTNGAGDMVGVTVDQAVIMEAGKTYGLRVRCADNSSFFRQLITVAGELTVLSFAIPVPAATSPKPAVGDLFMCGLYDNDSAEMIVVDISHEDDLTARITMLDYSPQIYAAESEAVPPYDPNTTERSEFRYVVPRPRFINIRTDESVLLPLPDDSVLSQIVVAMEPPEDYRVTGWEFQYKRSDAVNFGPVQYVGIGAGELVISGVEDGVDYDIQVRCSIQQIAFSEWLPLPTTNVVGKLTPPPAPLALTSIADRNVIKALLGPMPLDYRGTRWKAAVGDVRQWNLLTEIVNLQKTDELDTRQLPTGLITVGCKTVDAAGIESTDAMWLVFELEHWEIKNLVLQQDYHPTFDGVISGGTVSGGMIASDSTAGAYWGEDDGVKNWDKDDAELYWTDGTKRCTYEFFFTPDPSLAGKAYKVVMRNDIELIVDAAAGYFVQYQPVSDQPYWEDDDSALHWDRSSDSDLWWENSGIWLPWPGMLDGSPGEMRFRVTVFETTNEPTFIEQVSVVTDVLDLEERIFDQYIPATGAWVPVTKPFIFIHGAAVTPIATVPYPNVRSAITAGKDPAQGVFVYCFDAAGVACEGTVDVIVHGY